MLEDLCMCCSKRSWGWRKKCLSDLLTDAVNEVEQEQRSELGDGAKPGRSPAHGGAARPLGRRPGGVLRRSCSRARKPGAGGGGTAVLRGLVKPQNQGRWMDPVGQKEAVAVSPAGLCFPCKLRLGGWRSARQRQRKRRKGLRARRLGCCFVRKLTSSPVSP